MKISIIIPNYNSGKYLAKTLDSIFNQDYKNFEVIVADGGSTDNSLDVLWEYQKRHDTLYVYYDVPGKAVEHINAGMDKARGDVLAWLSADDTYEPGCFDAVVDCFSNPDVLWIYGKCKIINGEDVEVRGIITKLKEILQPRYSYLALQCACFIAEPSVFLRRSFYQRVGEFNNLPLTADYDYWLRAGKVSKPAFINRYLANWRAHSESTSVNRYWEQMVQAFRVQRQYSGWWLRPAQWMVCQFTVWLYNIIGRG